MTTSTRSLYLESFSFDGKFKEQILTFSKRDAFFKESFHTMILGYDEIDQPNEVKMIDYANKAEAIIGHEKLEDELNLKYRTHQKR